MIIILEGPDGSGKSHLAKQIAEQNDYPLIHRVAEDDAKPTAGLEYSDLIHARKNMVFDRAWYSEMVYGPIFRGTARIGYPQMFALEGRMARVGGLIIYCTGKPDVLWKRCQERGQDNPGGASFETDRDMLLSVCTSYDRIMYEVPHHIPVVRYEYTEI